VRAEILESGAKWAGKAEERKARLSFDTPAGTFRFPAHLALPKDGNPRPLIVYLSFKPYIDAYYMPVEEILDNGFALASFHYNDVSPDKKVVWRTEGLGTHFPRRGDGADWGQAGMWAYAASRVLDYALTLPGIDPARAFVVGHSRLGKTALWCAAQDDRFTGVGVNNSGFGGAAVTRG
jgi:hypothetical protein